MATSKPPLGTEIALIDNVALIVELPATEAAALAMFLKRLPPKAISQSASDATARREMRTAVEKLKYALADA